MFAFRTLPLSVLSPLFSGFCVTLGYLGVFGFQRADCDQNRLERGAGRSHCFH